MNFLYKGNQLVAEVPTVYETDGNTALQANWEEAIYWLYQGDDFTPTARYEKGQLHYTVSDQIGTITELMTEDGYIDYRQKLNLWGEAEIDGYRHHAANDSAPLKCNHRFVGQYYDEESGLHYNRFRYYSPETGQYVSSDPIGLLGGFNPYGYVGIPTAFVDPLGLQVCPIQKLKDRGYTGVTLTENGGLDYSSSNALYSNPKRPDVNPIQTIEYTWNYHADFEAANMVALGQKSTPKGYTWHHVDDYNPTTNSGTMQLVKTDAHTGIPHSGGVAQYKEATGNSYIFKFW